MPFEALKVGELAKQTGLTIRTLHHYDEIGLLKPSLHTEVGHRLYTAPDAARLQQVLSLRQLGFSLDEVRQCLDRPDFSPRDLIRLHVDRLREQIELHQQLIERLETIAAQWQTAEEVSADEFLHTIKVMTMTEKYFTPEEMELIHERRDQAGPERLRQAQEEWAELIALVRAEMDKGTDPADATVQALARRWQEKVQEVTAGDPGIERGLKQLWNEQGDALVAQHGPQYDWRPVAGYIGKAIAAAKGSA